MEWCKGWWWVGMGSVFKCSDDTRCLYCSNSLRRMRLESRNAQRSEIGLTRVARSSPRRRRPISPQAINTNKRHIALPSTYDEWPQKSPRALCPIWSCAAHNYCTWKTCMIQLQCTLFYNLSVLERLCSCVTGLFSATTGATMLVC